MRAIRSTLGLTLILLTGCNGLTPVHVLDQKEVVMLSEGDEFTAPYDGTFYSRRAEERIMKVKISKL